MPTAKAGHAYKQDAQQICSVFVSVFFSRQSTAAASSLILMRQLLCLLVYYRLNISSDQNSAHILWHIVNIRRRVRLPIFELDVLLLNKTQSASSNLPNKRKYLLFCTFRKIKRVPWIQNLFLSHEKDHFSLILQILML